MSELLPVKESYTTVSGNTLNTLNRLIEYCKITSDDTDLLNKSRYTHCIQESLNRLLLSIYIWHTFRLNLPPEILKDFISFPDLAEYIDGLLNDENPELAEKKLKLEPVPRGNIAPLSLPQKRLWLLEQITPGNPAYNIAGVVRFVGNTNTDYITQSFQFIVDRHESMRTCIRFEDETPIQFIHDRIVVDPERIDLQHLTGEEQQLTLYKMLQEEYLRPFDLTKAPLFRCRIYTLSENELVFQTTKHHIITDGWSSGVWVSEFLSVYNALAGGSLPELPPLPLQYADYSIYQLKLQTRENLEKSLSYWKENLSGDLPVLELPTDRIRPAIQTWNGSDYYFSIDSASSNRLKEVCRGAQATQFQALLTIFYILLYRYSGQEDIIVGTPIANRDSKEIKPILGFFVNMLPLRMNINHGVSFMEMLSSVKSMANGALINRATPFEVLVDELNIPRDMSRPPIFQVMFVLQNYFFPKMDAAGIEGTLVDFDTGAAQMDLTFQFDQFHDDSLSGRINYNTDLFDRWRMEAMVNHYIHILQAVLENPELPISAIPILSQSETDVIINEFSHSPSPSILQGEAATLYKNETLMGMFEKSVDKFHDQPALIFGDQSMSYEELNRKSNQLARVLRQKGASPDTLIGLICERSFEMVIGIYAILKSGSGYLPVDPTNPTDRIQFILEDSGAKVILTQNKFTDINQTGAETLLLDDENLFQGEDSNLEHIHTPDSLAYCIYTSGSTGKPKGVLLEHGGVVNMMTLLQILYPLHAEDRYLLKTTYAFDVSVPELFGWFHDGGALVILPPGAEKDPDVILNTIDRYGITHTNFAPAMLQALVNNMVNEENRIKFSSLKYVLVSGDIFPVGLAHQFRQSIPGDIKLENLYGNTENTIHTTRYSIKQEKEPEVLIGKPLPNVRCIIVDKHNNLQPIGVPGEICISGAGLARGYFNRPELTEKAFVPNPYAKDDRMYRTGDLARWMPDGNMEFLGRIDHQVKIRGFRIELGEIESDLHELDSIRECIVIPRDNDVAGKYLVAYIIPYDFSEDNSEQIQLRETIINHLKSKLPEYMVPSSIVFLEKFPLNANGKIDRRALPDPVWAGSKEYIAPQTEKEILFSEIWKDVLGLKQVGIQDNFFELGGDSIISIQIVSRAKQKGLKINVAQIFQHKTIQALAAEAVFELGKEHEAEDYILGEFPAGPVQKWFFNNNHVNLHRFNQSFLFTIDSGVTTKQLQQALDAVYEHHDLLRARFKKIDGQYIHMVPKMTGSFPLLSAELPLSAPDAIREKFHEMVQKINIFEGPLCGAVHIQKPDGNFLYMVIHHLVVDTVSWRILSEDLRTSLAGIQQNEKIELPQKTTSFRRWLDKLNEYSDSGSLLKEVHYWRNVVGEVNLPIPLDYSDGENLAKFTKEALTKISSRQTGSLLRDVPVAYNTRINDILLTAVGSVLTRWIGSDHILLNLEGHGREELFDDVDVSRTTGWFTSIFPVKLVIHENASISQRIKSVKEQLRSIPENGFGYGILRYLADTEIAETMVPQKEAEISFNYLGQFDTRKDGGIFRMIMERSLMPSDHGVENNRDHKMDIIAFIAEEELNIGIFYSSSLHESSTVNTLLSDIVKELDGIIEHCLSDNSGGLTPSDFPMANLTQDELDHMEDASGVADIYPMTPVQQGLLFHTLLEQGVYVTQFHWSIQGDLNREAFLEAWRRVLERHEALRASFWWNRNDKDLQIVHKHVDFPHQILDWRNLSDEEQKRNFNKLLKDDRSTGYDLKSAPLMRIYMVREHDNSYRVLWSHHHIIIDGWCLGLIFKDLFESYVAISHNREPVLENPVPYRNHVRNLFSSDIRLAEEFWKKNMAGFEAPTKLQFLGQSGGNEYRTIQHVLSPSLSESLRSFARNNNLTLNTIIQGSLAILLSRYTWNEDITFGMVSSGRGAESEKIVGLMLNTLPLRLQISPDEKIKDYLERVQQLTLQVREYEYASLTDIRSWAGLGGTDPLFEIILAFENYPLDRAAMNQLDGLTLGEFEWVEQPNYGLSIAVIEEKSIVIQASYHTGILTDSNANQFMEHLLNINSRILNPDSKIRDIKILNDSEMKTLTGTWNNTLRPLPISPRSNTEKLFLDTFHENVNTYPDRVAVRFEEESLSYQSLDELSTDIARTLISLKVEKNDFIGMLLNRGIHAPAVMIGIWKAGCAYLPIDPTYPEERIESMLDQTGVSIIITQNSVLQNLKEDTEVLLNRSIITLDPILENRSLIGRLFFQGIHNVFALEDRLQTAPPLTAVLLRVDDPAYAIFTSGTTGKPKGIINTQGNVANLIQWAKTGIPSIVKGGVTQFASFSFDVSVAEIYPPLALGSSISILSQEQRTSLPAYMELLQKHKIKITSIPPALLYQLIDLIEETPSRKEFFSEVEQVICGGDALLTREVQRWQSLFGSSPAILNVYGPTETTVLSSSYPVPFPVETNRPVVLLGTPIDNTKFYIVDKTENLCPVSVVGEISIAGAGVARGYMNDPERNTKKFYTDPYGDESLRIYQTGDLGRWTPDGLLEFLGREDHQVKIRGFRVEPAEIQSILMDHDDVNECLILAHAKGESEKQLVAYITGSEKFTGEEAKAQENMLISRLREYVRSRLPDYMVPSLFIVLDKFPLTPNGKVDRKALPDPRWMADKSYTPPETELEKRVAGIFEQILDVSPVGLYDNFFEIGGHSLLLTKLVTRLESELNVTLSLQDIFQYPTVEEMARLLQSGSNAHHTDLDFDPSNEGILSEDIKLRGLPEGNFADPGAILLTGATGFLGAFLLSQLLNKTNAVIYCLVRADSESAGFTRIKNNMEDYLLWRDDFAGRIKVLPGDLGKERLGLSDKDYETVISGADYILHNGAHVNFIYPYSMLKAANVDSCEEVLRMATEQKIKSVHFISTLSVFSPLDGEAGSVIRESQIPAHPEALLEGGYSRSKWAGEKLMLEAQNRGLPVSIYRPGLITGSSKSGAWTHTDMFARIVRGIIDSGNVPPVNVRYRLLPVDYVSDVISHLMLNEPGAKKIYHLDNSHEMELIRIVDFMRSFGYDLRNISYDQFIEDMQNNADHPLAPLADMILNPEISKNSETHPDMKEIFTIEVEFGQENTRNGTRNSEIRMPDIDEKLFHNYFNFFIDKNLLHKP